VQLVCFVERPKRDRPAQRATEGQESRVVELERELEAARTERDDAVHNLEAASEEQKAVEEEALSANEEYQSTNEELLTSKEELQSLNEELTALNSQLQETLERQRATSNDMQNILYSTDLATLFLDKQLKIRFFTPATRSLFKVLPGDVGRPLADLVSLAGDGALLEDAQAVLKDLAPVEREIEASGVWFVRRVLPYRTEGNGAEGVVITFTDVTGRKSDARALEAAKQEAERANAAKSRFLSAASHDLRQPLQTLSLLQGLLARTVQGEAAKKLVERVDDTLGAMSSMLNTVLDLNQIEAGVVRAQVVRFPLGEVLARLRDEFNYQAQAQGLTLRVVPCSLSIDSDPRLLERILRNLVSNALKYTRRGRVLLGCRRRGATLRIEVWDTGVGIPDDKLQFIFNEYTQVDNAGRDRSRGMGLGLSIVRRLCDLLGHKVMVRSRRGQGSVFSIELPLAPEPVPLPGPLHLPGASSGGGRRSGEILVVEDDPAVRELLELFLRDEGHRVVAADNAASAADLVAQGATRPDLLLVDYNLPGGLNGVQLAARLREILATAVPVVVLTGDISAEALGDIAQAECVQLSKPVKLAPLAEAIHSLLPPMANADPIEPHEPAAVVDRESPVVFVVDDDANVRTELRNVLEAEGRTVEDHPSSEAFLRAYGPGRSACLLIDAYLPGLSGLDLLRHLRDRGDRLPAIMITGHSDVHMAVEAMKAGASDFIEKPVARGELLASIERAFEHASDSGKLWAQRAAASSAVQSLTPRQREIMGMVIAGQPSKNIAADLGISQRTVENHRAAIMEKTGSKSIPALARLAVAAAWTGSHE
jgi:two-component system CheB/CheR fusion protein